MTVGKRPYLFAVVLEVNKEDKGLARVRIKDAIARNFEAWVEVGDGICLVKNLEERIDVETAEGAIRGEGGCGVPNVEVVIVCPYIRLDTGASGVDGGEKRFFAPVVIMGMTCNRIDVGRDVGGPVAQVVR